MPPDGNPRGQGDCSQAEELAYQFQRAKDFEQALGDALGAIKLAYRHVGSMLPERLDPVNARLHRQAMQVLKSALS